MNILELLQNHGITAKKVANSKGGEYHSPCPACGGEDRFHSWPAQNEGAGSFWCRGCGEGGDLLQFLMVFDGMTFPEARRHLGLADDDMTSPSQNRRAKPEKPCWQPEDKDHPVEVVDLAAWRQHANKFVEKCHQELLATPKAIAWLAKRGIDQGAILKYKLGLHKTDDYKPSYRPRISWGLTGGINPTTKRQKMFVLPSGIVIPWFVNGQLHRIRIRLAKPDPKYPKKKYHAVVGSAMDTFATAENREVYVVIETELDAIMIDTQAGELAGAVAVGSSHAKPTARAAASLLEADRVLNALDFDKAGAGASEWWQENIKNNHRYPAAKGGDPGEAYELGLDIKKWISAGLPASLQISSIDDIFTLKPVKKAQKPAETPKKEETKPDQATQENKNQADDVSRLAALLATCPVWIKNKDGELLLKEGVTFDHKKHWDQQKEISNLLFTSDDVLAYLGRHPDSAINGHNFLIN